MPSYSEGCWARDGQPGAAQSSRAPPVSFCGSIKGAAGQAALGVGLICTHARPPAQQPPSPFPAGPTPRHNPGPATTGNTICATNTDSHVHLNTAIPFCLCCRSRRVHQARRHRPPRLHRRGQERRRRDDHPALARETAAPRPSARCSDMARQQAAHAPRRCGCTWMHGSAPRGTRLPSTCDAQKPRPICHAALQSGYSTDLGIAASASAGEVDLIIGGWAKPGGRAASAGVLSTCSRECARRCAGPRRLVRDLVAKSAWVLVTGVAIPAPNGGLEDPQPVPVLRNVWLCSPQ